jgi:putative membrane protein
MQTVPQAVALSWSIPPLATFALVLTGLTYLRGAWLLRRAGYPYLPAWRISSFLLGEFALWFALASPLDTFSSFVLTAHMLQHMILMMVAPPLLLLGEPLIPIVRGLPRFAAREFAGPFLNWQLAGRIGLILGTVMFVWHVPGPYELAVRSSAWHEIEHACFFFASIIFWWPVIQPWPSRAYWPRWAMVPYLVIADLQNTVLSAVLVFSDRILYPSYGHGPRLFGFTPQEDQAAAGAMMWVVGSLAFIVPAVLIAMRELSRRRVVLLAPGNRQDEAPAVYRTMVVGSQGSRDFNSPSNWIASSTFEVISFLVLFSATGVGFVVLSGLSTGDDDQVLLASQQAGPFAVSVYGPAGEIPSGTNSFGVLVQDPSSHNVLLESDVSITARRADADATSQLAHALPGDENKLLLSAHLDVDGEGSRLLEVTVRNTSRSGVVSVPIEVVKPGRRRAFPLSYIVVLSFTTILGVAYLRRHRSRSSPGLTAPVT